MDPYQQKNEFIQTLPTTVPQQQNIINTTIAVPPQPTAQQHLDNQQQLLEKLTPHSNGTSIEIKSTNEKVENNLCNCYPIDNSKEKNTHQSVPAQQQPLITGTSQIGMENSTNDKLLSMESSTKSNHAESIITISSNSNSNSDSNRNSDSHNLDIDAEDSDDKRQNLSDMELEPINNESSVKDEEHKPFIQLAVEQKQHPTADNCVESKELKLTESVAATVTGISKPVEVTSNSETKVTPTKLLPEQKPPPVPMDISPPKPQNASTTTPTLQLTSPSVSKQQQQSPVKLTKTQESPKSQEEPLKTLRKESKQPVQKTSIITNSTVGKIKRQRIKTQHYQSPIPEMELISKKIHSSSSSSVPRSKLIIFYKNEFLAVRNPEGSFYLCKTTQNIYKSSQKIKVRWLSQDKTNEKSGDDIYTADFYDTIEIDCILTSLKLTKVDKGKKYRLPAVEKNRIQSILNRALAVEKGEEVASPSITEEHPDGLDLSLYKDENQLKKGKRNYNRKRKASDSDTDSLAPAKGSPPTPAKQRKIIPTTSSASKKNNSSTPKRAATATTSKETPKKANTPKKRSSGRSKKGPAKPNVTVDQKKAKVLAKIQKKTVLRSKSNQSNNHSKKTKSVPKTTPNTRRTTAASTRAASSGSQAKGRY